MRREKNHGKKKKEVIELNDSKEKRNRTKAEAKNGSSKNPTVMNTSLKRK